MSLWHLIVLSLALGIGAWLFFLWSVRSGQYDDPEGPKYRMLEDDDGEEGGASREERPEPGRPAGDRRGEAERGRR
jgi:cbb3-type cytochrome oxidase maturation protein